MVDLRYVTCKNCGKFLMKASPGTKAEITCPKCKNFASIVIDADSVNIGDLPLNEKINSKTKAVPHKVWKNMANVIFNGMLIKDCTISVQKLLESGEIFFS